MKKGGNEIHKIRLGLVSILNKYFEKSYIFKCVSAEQCGAEEIWLSCRNARSLAPGTTDAVKLVRFFDKVIEKKQIIREGYNTSDRRRFVSPYTSPEQSPLIFND